MPARLFVLVGIPGCGKTTYARKYLAHALRVSLDDLRLMLSGRPYDPRVEPIVRVAGEAVLCALLARANEWQVDIVFDATNATRFWREKSLRLAQRHGVVPVAVYFPCALEVALARNRQRPVPVPEEVIRRFAAQLEPPSREEGFAEVLVVEDFSP